MAVLTIAPLSTPGAISLSAHRAITGAARLYLQTEHHPSARWIAGAGLSFETMDELYRGSTDFDSLNAAIAERLTGGGDAVYAVPGRGPGEAQLSAILAAAERAGMEVERLPGSGYAEAAAASLPSPIGPGVICAANSLPCPIDPFLPLYIEELDTPLRAGEVKLALGEYYPDEHPLWFCPMDEAGRYAPRSIPLYELDRQAGYFAAACCIVPPAASQEQLSRGGAEELMAIMRRLRAPGGCPWDAEQTHASIRSSLIEEAYEVADAIDRQDDEALCEELGDLLLQVAFHAVMAEETASFTFRDVSTGIINKLIYRHPHVFGQVRVDGSEQVLANWEQLKRREKHQATYTDAMRSVPMGFPALMRSAKVQKKAANAGFDWDCAQDALFKLPEEFSELKEAMAEGSPAHIDEELGDLLFAAVNVIRLLKRDPEALLHAATDKFMARFAKMEELIIEKGLAMEGMPLAELDAYWDAAKAQMQKK